MRQSSRIMTEIAEHIGRRIKALREAQGITQHQLAKHIGKSVETISNIERAKVTPGLNTLVIFAEKLNCQVRDFLDNYDVDLPTAQLTADQQKIMNALKLLDENDTAILAGLVDVLEKRQKK